MGIFGKDRIFIAGGAGFIGSALARRLLKSDPFSGRIVVYDNFSSGTPAHLDPFLHDSRLKIVKEDIQNLSALEEAMRGAQCVWHFASNPDIARAATEPEIDLYQGTMLTSNVLEAMRRTGVLNLVYASGSGVYGDVGYHEAGENYSPLRPISTYGASKLAGEALISAYCHMYGLRARAYRFANVVGPFQTHGVGYDFVRRLVKRPKELSILGDGRQSKSYIHVDDVLDAIEHTFPLGDEAFDVYNVATGDYITVNEIAELAISLTGIPRDEITIVPAGGSRGWKGDVPVVRFNLEKIHKTGWSAKSGSRDALESSMRAMLNEISHE